MIDLFLDSGAFSAYTQKKEIKINEYISFIKENEKYFSIYANLDVIGDAAGTYKNQKYMESKGLNPLPVYHAPFEDPDIWLKKYMEEGYTHIAFGGMAGKDVHKNNLLLILDKCFDKYICSADGTPKIKVHGFGMTSHDLLIRYPWYSVDSTSWVISSRLGSIYMPKKTNGKYDYLKSALKIKISNQSENGADGQCFASMSAMEKKEVLEYLSFIGYPLGSSTWKDGEETVIESGVINDYKKQDQCNILYFQALEKAIPPFGEHKFKKPSLMRMF